MIIFCLYYYNKIQIYMYSIVLELVIFLIIERMIVF